jgi:hypothetical protein
MARKNYYAGACSGCGANVGVGQGFVFGPPWVTKCALCAGELDSVKIEVARDGQNVLFRIHGFLGDRFGEYRAATASARYDGTRRVNVASLDKAMFIVDQLRKSGFVLDMLPELSAALQAKAADFKAGVTEAEGRLDEADALLRGRGLFLFPFQREGVRWLTNRWGALLADQMGLGKTVQALLAIPKKSPVIIVAPAVAKGVWKREAAKWRPDLKIEVLSGRGSFRWPQAGEVIVINYDILPAELVGNCACGTVLIADEAHAVKNSKALRTTRFRNMSELVRKNQGKVWLLTATPLLNRPQEIWSVLQAADIAREAFGSWDNFCVAFNGWRGDYGYEWGTPDEALVTKHLRKVSLRRMRIDVLPELPVKTYRQVSVSIDAKAVKACDKAMNILRAQSPSLWDRIISDEDPFEADLPEPLALESIEDARAKIARMDGTSFTEFSRAREMLARAKIPALLEMVSDYEEQEEPVVVFSAHLAAVDLLATREGWAKITGEIPAEERSRIEEDFQNGKLKGIAATIKAGGVAITLTKACHAIFLDQEFTPALNEQAEDRVCRIGQSRGVVITQIVAEHPLDARIFTLLASKQAMINASVDASRIRAGDSVEPVLLPEVDFARLAEEAANEARKADEAKKNAEERIARYAEERAKAVAENRMLPPELRHVQPADEPARRGPASARDKWAMSAVLTLAGLDPDRARMQNDVGFNASDGGIGHKLANEVLSGLTDKQWELAAALCTKYWRQVGRPPANGES